MSESFEEFLNRAAADYNRPPETPRDAMWAAIEARRGAARRGDAATRRRGETARERADRRWFGRPLTVWAVGLAATLVLGFGLGRIVPIGGDATEAARANAQGPAAGPEGSTVAATDADAANGQRTEDASATAPENLREPAESRPVSAADPTVLAASPDAVSPRRGVAASPRQGVASSTGEAVASGDGRVADPADAAAQPAVLADAGTAAGTSSPEAASTAPRAQIYRFAANTTLSQAEALLTAYRADAAAGRVDPQIERWARDVLSTTRLLLDSPAAEDPRLARLLGDLELVLVQLVQLGGEPAAAELEMIDETMQRRDVLPRLRTATPAGPVLMGTD